MTRWVVRVPPLVDRLEDLPLLAADLARRVTGEPRPLSARAVIELLRAPWPGNLHELAGVVERAALERPEGELRCPAGLVAAPRADDGRHRMRVAASGRWFELDGIRCDLSRRRALTRLVTALVARRQERPGATLSREALLRAGWPGEAALGESGSNRVYVAITKLRKLGLRPVLERDADGYRLAATCDVAVDPGD